MPRRASPALRGSVRPSSGGLLRAGLAAFVLVCAQPAAAAPERVVSMNVCTDQLAMLVAAPGQLHSVSWLARDPGTSAMAEAAADWPVNHGRAEEIFVMQPDLVLAGSYTARPAVDLLRRLGFEVVEFAPETSIEDIRDNLRRMGKVLGQEARAEAVVAAFDAELAAIPSTRGPAPRAVVYNANSFTAGAGTLSDALVRAAGFENVAVELGLNGMTHLPLELLVMSAPDLVILGERRSPPSVGEAVLDHPALRHLRDSTRPTVVEDSAWVCGTPATAAAVARLAARRAELAGE